ncbi:class II aldolase/adducin family protein [Cupriavidus sp. BIC8F]|uniref:class II aldolase/adducin family protein n=1 Tax=Cupriavidus sp. BIC8F TaxID=3079014 RepID=UPI002916C0D3|nr:class II aldolase/adducin family protein [Cupriavidus sp. BIC8F]
MRTAVTEYCAKIGRDSLLVQGAGGNVSWKDGDTLWVKASGMWLADAKQKDIFVPVDLAHLCVAIASGNMEVQPHALESNGLRPSIETLLHALMPHRIVVHLHAIEALAHLVRSDYASKLTAIADENLRWASVSYFKPGAELARAVDHALKKSPGTDIVFLKSHGVVIGGDDVNEVHSRLRKITSLLQTSPYPLTGREAMPRPITTRSGLEYLPVPDPTVQQLALNPALYEQLRSNWALYPDHLVFLGVEPFCQDSPEHLARSSIPASESPELVFVRDLGVFSCPSLGAGKLAQLRCYYDVLARQHEPEKVTSLTLKETAALLDWDAEKYRMQLAK